MKSMTLMLALALALAMTGPSFAQDAAAATDKASCDKAGGTWDDAAKKCSPKCEPAYLKGLPRALASAGALFTCTQSHI